MLDVNDLTPWLDLGQNAIHSIMTFLKEGSSSNRGYELFRFLLLPVVWTAFAYCFLRQVLLLRRYPEGITWPRISGLMWVLPAWLATLWQEPSNGLYLGAVVICAVHMVLWYAGMFRWRLRPSHLVLAGVLMAAGLYVTAQQLSRPPSRGIPQASILVHNLSPLLLAQTYAYECFGSEGCASRISPESRRALNALTSKFEGMSEAFSRHNCYITGHSPSGLVYCANEETHISLRAYVTKLYPVLPSAKCQMLTWVHEAWQPNGFWPENPPLSLLATQREELLECPHNTGADGEPFESAIPTSHGTFMVSSREAVFEDWKALQKLIP